MQIFFSTFVLSLFSLAMLYGAEARVPRQPGMPWLTGTLLAPVGEVVKVGSYEIDGYFFANVNIGKYDCHGHFSSTPNFYNCRPQILGVVGLTEWMDIQMLAQVVWNETKGRSAVRLGDLPIGLDFQLLRRCASSRIPAVKLSIGETFPTGKYQKLDPHQLGVDRGGLGTFATNFSILFYQLYKLAPCHFLSNYLGFAYTLNSPVHVKGFNSYGGGYGTNGKVYPGNLFTALFSFEYTFNQHWVFAMDNVYTYTGRTRFSGEIGMASSSTASRANPHLSFIPSGNMSAPAAQQLSLAPALEYNFSAKVGMIAGVWFSVWGKNSPAFISGVFEFDYEY